MTARRPFLLPLLAFCAFAACSESTPPPATPAIPTIEFRQVEYFNRWNKGDQHEFTPTGQEDLERWTDMITVNNHPRIKTEDLPSLAEAVLDGYKKGGASILASETIEVKDGESPEYLIVGLFQQAPFMEMAFCRIFLNEGEVTSLIYARRSYGPEADKNMNDWANKNGQACEDALVRMEKVPTSADLPLE